MTLRSDLEFVEGRGVETTMGGSVKSWGPGQIYVDADRPGSAAAYAGLPRGFDGVNFKFWFCRWGWVWQGQPKRRYFYGNWLG